jgi:hypothetical protein
MTGHGLSKIDALIADGVLDARKAGKRLLITIASIEAYCQALPKADLKPRFRKRTAPTPSPKGDCPLNCWAKEGGGANSQDRQTILSDRRAAQKRKGVRGL